MQKYICQNIYRIVEKDLCGESLFFRNSGRMRSI